MPKGDSLRAATDGFSRKRESLPLFGKEVLKSAYKNVSLLWLKGRLLGRRPFLNLLKRFKANALKQNIWLEGRRSHKNRFRHPRKTRREIMKQYLRKSIKVNGYPHHVIASPDTMLVNIIRKQIGLTGTKLGCGSGQCGACEVIVNGKLTRSCIVRWDRVPEDAEILTIEGLGTPDKLHALQWAYVKTGAIQCGFCTPGFIMSSKALLDENLNPTREEIREWFHKNRNACRCNGYIQIVDAVMLAAKVLRGEEKMTDFSEMLGRDGSVWGSRFPRPSAVYKATGTWDFGDDVALKLPDETLFAVCVCP